MRADIVPGSVFPDYVLPDHTAKRRKLSELPVEELRQDLRAVTKKCRPDWDITSPELKAAWQQGRKESFFPYGKTYAQIIAEQG